MGVAPLWRRPGGGPRRGARGMCPRAGPGSTASGSPGLTRYYGGPARGQVRSGKVRSGQVYYSAEVQDHESQAKKNVLELAEAPK